MEKPASIQTFKKQAIAWANQFEVCCILDSNSYNDPYSSYDYLIAAGVSAELRSNSGRAFEELKAFYHAQQTWIFGFMGYDLKNETEALTSGNRDHLNFPDLYFFSPKYVIAIKNDEVNILKGNNSILDEIRSTEIQQVEEHKPVNVQQRLSKTNYINCVNQLKAHILKGDIYEVNFCQEFFAEHANINPLATYEALNALSPTPFSGYFKINHKYILSATPERFICKRGEKLISQPIKGTIKRGYNAKDDERVKEELRNDPKEQSENVMIVDLVRHDLTKSALKGTVKVDELFGVYSFPQVHQLISTVSCTINPEIHFIDAIKNCFPMGSMTGAPKLRAMQLIEEYEASKRGVYSGSFGCITPEGDFDFNVIIRSILYNEHAKYLSFQVGGAITYACDAEKEYDECLVKASAIMQVLAH